MMDISLFILSFIVLWKSADYFVDSSHSLAIHFKLPPILIGATVVAFGTSAPELFVTIFAAYSNQSNVVYGNILGSNIANTFLIFGLCLIMSFIKFNTLIRSQLLINLFAIIVSSFGIYFVLPSRWLGLVLLIFFGIIQFYILRNSMIQKNETPQYTLFFSLVYFFVSLVFLIGSSKMLVVSLLNTAEFIGVSTAFLSLFAVAFGTSLPELVSTISFVRKGHMDIVIGNVFGSNFFNLMFVMPIAWLVFPVPFAFSFFIEVGILFFITLILIVLSVMFNYSYRIFGVLGLIFYLSYIFFRYYFVV